MADKVAYKYYEFLEALRDGSIDKNALALGVLKDEFKTEFIEKYAKVQSVNSKKNLNGIDDKEDNMIKGKALEELVQFLFTAIGTDFKVYSNIHTTTNEIDVLAVMNNQIDKGLVKTVYDSRFDKFLCECKNYSIPVGVTYVGKFCHLTLNSNINIGILFSLKGIADTSKHLVQKTYYYKENKGSKVYIIDFSKAEFDRFIAGESFFDIINEKCNELELDVDFTKYFVNHPNENDVNEWLEEEKKIE